MRNLTLRLVYNIVLKAFLKIVVGVKFDNGKFLLTEKQFVIVANHNSHLDTMTLMASLPGKIIHRVKPVAAADHFGKTALKAKFTRWFVNALLIQRKRDKENPENDPINQMIRAIDEGYSLIIFPEGTRGQPEVQQPLKPGIAYLLKSRPYVKYVPAYLKGMGKAMPKDDNLIVPHASSLTYGKPSVIKSDNVSDILRQIEDDMNALQIKSL
jgi:1-acyl-sn-glycerol-3-phosphate acyltransferase